MVTVVDDLFQANDWAHARLMGMCAGLSDEQLDAQQPMGFGTLRATWYHILAAERIWLERWRGVPWRPFPTDPAGMPLAQIQAELAEMARDRQALIESERASEWQRMVTYRDSKGHEYTQRLDDLLFHVANHGVHHRAQLLSFLKRNGRTVPGGLDYIFYRLAYPTVSQDQTTVEGLRQFGLEVGVGEGQDVVWDRRRMKRLYAYHDWANQQILARLVDTSDAVLDQDHQLGLGSIRKTMLHLMDAERWWLKNWFGGSAPMDHSPVSTTLVALQAEWSETARQRNALVESLDAAQSQRIVTVLAGPHAIRFRVIESLVQLLTHGTHHRAQLLNMLRQVELAPPAIDYMVWIRDVA